MFRYTLSSQRIIYNSIHRKCRCALPLSKRFMGVLSVGEIHCLRRLRKEGFPDFLRRSQQLVCRNAAQFVCGRAHLHFRPLPKNKIITNPHVEGRTCISVRHQRIKNYHQSTCKRAHPHFFPSPKKKIITPPQLSRKRSLPRNCQKAEW